MTARVFEPDPPPTPEALVDQVLGGAPGAWGALAELVHGHILDLCRRRRWVANAPTAADLHREVALRVLEKLHAGDYAALRQWAAARDRYPDARFTAWLGAVASNALIDLTRRTRTTEELAEEPAAIALAPGDAIDLARVVRALTHDQFPADQRTAIAMWLRGHDAAAIAAELGLGDSAAANRLLHAARERLRRAMRPEVTHD
ncbi:MAG: sigma-70 family RNA polymerase sigma factor [Deltaproteobacteria bacterium]|nr:sigma-70 family RNA polymerase sigma factor [Deltaproteobacteria bacterium]